MHKTFVVFVLVFASSFAPNLAQAFDCPIDTATDDYLGKVVDSINAAANCDEAVSVARSCALNATSDLVTTMAATENCDASFLKNLSRKEATTYGSLQAKCRKKYAKRQGSMYTSAAAFCRLNVTLLFYQLYSPID